VGILIKNLIFLWYVGRGVAFGLVCSGGDLVCVVGVEVLFGRRGGNWV